MLTTPFGDMTKSKFKTKIVQRFVGGYEFYELLIPNGKSVASGSLSHCWDERERWEEKLTKIASRRCQHCKQWEYTKTIGSPDTPVWHCRHGFTPSGECQDEAAYNDKLRQEYYRKHPEELQLQFDF